jgi:hypothetical protein
MPMRREDICNVQMLSLYILYFPEAIHVLLRKKRAYIG